jgi:hypothetical protein
MKLVDYLIYLRSIAMLNSTCKYIDFYICFLTSEKKMSEPTILIAVLTLDVGFRVWNFRNHRPKYRIRNQNLIAST